MSVQDGVEFRVPDVVGAIVGWRTWDVKRWQGSQPSVDPVKSEPWLSSRTTWLPGEVERAFHQYHGGFIGGPFADQHEAPAPGCLCGIHAIKEPADLIGQPGAASPISLRDGTSVAGQVALWGRVIPHELGWRAEYVCPLSIVPLWEDDEPDPVRAVRDRYGLPLVECPEMADAVATWKSSCGQVVVHFAISTAQAAQAMQDVAKAMDDMVRRMTQQMALQVRANPATYFQLHTAPNDSDAQTQKFSVPVDFDLADEPALDNPTKPRKPAYTSLNPNDPANRKGGRRGSR